MPLPYQAADDPIVSQCPACQRAKGMPCRVTSGIVHSVTFVCPVCKHQWDIQTKAESDVETPFRPRLDHNRQ